MKEAERIADQLRRSFDGEAWHGPAVLELLQGVTAAQAAARPLAGAHSIWELTLHIGVWEDVPRRRLLGERKDDVPPAEDWPPVTDTSAAAWKSAVEQLQQRHRQLLDVISNLSDDGLAQTVPGMGYSVYGMLHGVVQHNLYHAGQIALLKKALT